MERLLPQPGSGRQVGMGSSRPRLLPDSRGRQVVLTPFIPSEGFGQCALPEAVQRLEGRKGQQFLDLRNMWEVDPLDNAHSAGVTCPGGGDV